MIIEVYAVTVPLLFGLLFCCVSLWGYSEEEFTSPRPPASRNAPAFGLLFGGILILSGLATLMSLPGAP